MTVAVGNRGGRLSRPGHSADGPAACSQQVLDQQSLKRRGTPDELAAAASFPAGPDAPSASGQTIEVNGGWVVS